MGEAPRHRKRLLLTCSGAAALRANHRISSENSPMAAKRVIDCLVVEVAEEVDRGRELRGLFQVSRSDLRDPVSARFVSDTGIGNTRESNAYLVAVVPPQFGA